MTQSVEARGATTGATGSKRLIVQWAHEMNEQGLPMRWLGSWLIDDAGTESSWFHSGIGSGTTAHDVPGDAVGVRIRRWLSEGLDPEYIDLPLDTGATLRTQELDFDAPQPHRMNRVSQG